jgi:hypothetical protein
MIGNYEYQTVAQANLEVTPVLARPTAKLQMQLRRFDLRQVAQQGPSFGAGQIGDVAQRLAGCGAT